MQNLNICQKKKSKYRNGLQINTYTNYIDTGLPCKNLSDFLDGKTRKKETQTPNPLPEAQKYPPSSPFPICTIVRVKRTASSQPHHQRVEVTSPSLITPPPS